MPETRNLKQGEILFVQGENPDRIFMLQEGEIEILSAPAEFLGLDKSIIIDKSVRVASHQGKAMLLGYSGLLASPYTRSARAVTASQVMEYPLPQGGFRSVAGRDLNTAINMLRQLFNNFITAQGHMKKAVSVYVRFSQVDDNMALVYSSLSQGSGPDSINKKSDNLRTVFSMNRGTIPAIITVDFLLEDRSALLKKSYSEKITTDSLAPEYADLAKRILKLDPQIIASMLKADPDIALSLFTAITRGFDKMFENTYSIMEKIEQKIKTFFDGPDSWANYFTAMNGLKTWASRGGVASDFQPNLARLMQKLEAMALEVNGRGFGRYDGYTRLMNVLAKKSEPVKASAAGEIESPAADFSGAPATVSTGLQKSIFQIFEFAMVEKEFQNRLLKMLNDFKTSKNPFGTESDERKMRRYITQLYWELYKQVFVRSKIEATTPRAAKLMLSYGFLDDTMLMPEQLAELNDFARMRERQPEFPVYSEYEFLSMIYNNEEEPSITEMGLAYDAYLREQDKYQKKGKGDDENREDPNSPMSKTLHEISQRLASTAAVCSGGTATAFPILTAELIKGSLKNLYQTKHAVSEVITKLRDIDYSVFYRETVLRLDSAREVIEEEVIPYFVLLPIYGTKTLLWQEISGNNKRSLGRIMIPIFFAGELEKSLMHSFACFRWELNRSMKGAMWADPIEGGISGEYFDYVNTFKKNSRLSPEMKEKIALRFKALRTNRDRFADDYMLWVEYEREGIMKLNNVVREMFFKHMPFKKETREMLEGMPAYAKYAGRYKNVQAREIAAFERKFKKYQNETGLYPPEIEKFFEYLRM
ncbi:MAG TPA: cyclic nucleotide-binding domain-containing protein [Spirochaetota bacterium]|nr:cyclic nucleotide-binding domain-containing protein [Spirochaetota bacterium]